MTGAGRSRIPFAIVRTGIAAAIIAAVAGQLRTTADFVRDQGVEDLTTTVVNFLSFFTVDSNVAAAAVLLIGAVLLVTRSGTDPAWFQVARAAVVSYMVTTGIVYNLLLRGIDLPQGSTLGWSNEILHVVAPVYLLLDWILAPGRAPLSMRVIRVVVVFPIVWAAYTLVRGPLVTNPVTGAGRWYPYPFLDPATSVNGYASVAFSVLLIAAVICLVAAGVVRLSRGRSPAASASASASAPE